MTWPRGSLSAALRVLALTLALALAVLGGAAVRTTVRPSSCPRVSQAGDSVVLHYTGARSPLPHLPHTLGRLQATGETFDTSYERGEPITVQLGAGEMIEARCGRCCACGADAR